jgi:hypothetical protein
MALKSIVVDMRSEQRASASIKLKYLTQSVETMTPNDPSESAST